MFNKNRLKLAREIRRLSKAQLSEQINRSVQTLTEWEKGTSIPKLDSLVEISKALKFPINFFNSEIEYSFLDNTFSFRALTKMKAGNKNLAYSYAKLAIDLSDWIEERFNTPRCTLKSYCNKTPEEAAKILRLEWDIKTEGIEDCIFLLEKNGVKVFSLLENIEYVDAFSFWNGNNIPFVLLTHQKSAERSRFDAMHELGHLLLHKEGKQSSKEAEKEANDFASEMLIPKSSLEKYKNINPSLQNFIDLKHIWKVSLKALIYRFYNLGYITEWTFKVLMIEMQKRGYTQNEPKTIALEESTVINMVSKLLKQDNLLIQDIVQDTEIPAEYINKLLFNKFNIYIMHDRNGSNNNKPDLFPM